jgi:RNA polymerase sigma-70 factor (ECF subfamily)
LRPHADAGTSRFAELVRRHEHALYTYASRHLRCEQDARDCVQEALLAAWRAGAAERDPALPARAWLLRITQRKVLDIVSKRRRQQAVGGLDAEIEMVSTGQDEQAAVVERAHIAEALGWLRPELRSVALARLVCDLSEAQTAQRLGLPLNTAKSRLFRARGGLVAALAQPSDAA